VAAILTGKNIPEAEAVLPWSICEHYI